MDEIKTWQTVLLKKSISFEQSTFLSKISNQDFRFLSKIVRVKKHQVTDT
jgi:hypothetical protein